MSNSSFVRLATIGVLALSFALTACGRRGPLDLPPRATAQPADQQQQATGEPQQQVAARQQSAGWPFGQSDPDEPAGPGPKPPKKTFFLDFLLN